MSAEPSPPKEVVTTASYGDKTFHLFQAVRICPVPVVGDWPHRWVVVDLDGGVTVAAVSVDEKREYSNEDELSNVVPISENGIPVYGH